MTHGLITVAARAAVAIGLGVSLASCSPSPNVVSMLPKQIAGVPILYNRVDGTWLQTNQPDSWQLKGG